MNRSNRRRSVLFSLLVLSGICAAQDNSSQSLADIARKLRKDVTEEVRMSDADEKKLFASVDRILAFAAEDSGMPRHATVKRRLVGKSDVQKFATGRLAKEQYTQRFAQSELSMKKLGFLPREFDLAGFLVKSTTQQVAGYYDDETKMISLLNWVPADRQEPILAHELTHALQDQNYDLMKWMKAGSKPGASSSKEESENDDSTMARKAVVEGQAMVVYVDYLLAPAGRNLADTPGLIYSMEEPAIKAAQDSQLMHDAPMIMREAGSFAYNGGLIFEGELLHKGGRKMAFEGVFARPPRNSHEVLDPNSYINHEKPATVGLPDLQQVIGEQYEVYDSGGVGQLDVRAYLRQFGERKNAEDLSSFWNGGAYVTYRRKDKADATALTTADLALLYVSRWRNTQAAEHFANFYASAIPLRYRTVSPQSVADCSSSKCPVSRSQFLTEEGPVVVERWADNTVIVSEGLDVNAAAKVSEAVRNETAHHAANFSQEEIGLGLYRIPAFRNFAAAFGIEFTQELTVGQ